MSKEKSDKHESRPLGAAREATFPNFPPTISELRARALRAEAQYLMVEHYAGAIGDKKRRVNDDTKLIEFAQKTPGDQPDGSPDRANGNYADGNPAQTLNATADSIRAAKDLLRELAPVQQPATPSLSREEIIQMISQAVADVADATRPQEKSEIARLRELLEFQQCHSIWSRRLENDDSRSKVIMARFGSKQFREITPEMIEKFKCDFSASITRRDAGGATRT